MQGRAISSALEAPLEVPNNGRVVNEIHGFSGRRCRTLLGKDAIGIRLKT